MEGVSEKTFFELAREAHNLSFDFAKMCLVHLDVAYPCLELIEKHGALDWSKVEDMEASISSHISELKHGLFSCDSMFTVEDS
jgi:hypothetical protein